MKLFGYFETVKPLLVKQINKFFLQQKDFPNKQLLQSLQAFNLKGKLLRGMLVLLINKMEGGQINEKVLNVATAMELVHSGLLIHDDIMDKDLFRRGFPTIHKSFGQSMAICAGDWLFCKAIELIDDNELIKIMSVGVQQVMHGQILDVFFSETNNNPNQSTILDIYRKKTAFYSFSLPFKLGAMLQKASLKKLDILNSLGENLGLIFQIKDDEMGIFGDEKATGKPTGSDIR
ncbi:polyprenyl synthetase family protein, partial [Candidatus Roizmanbacteria bacterium]|nr:polyprenyl synthetase family protein [Candidatus Roizmanbacteria bacterium]